MLSFCVDVLRYPSILGGQVPLYYWCTLFSASEIQHLRRMWHLQVAAILGGSALVIAWSVRLGRDLGLRLPTGFQLAAGAYEF